MNSYDNLKKEFIILKKYGVKDWLILLSDFFDKYEGGQTISLLEEENKKLEKEVKELEKELEASQYNDGCMFGRGKYE